MRYAELTIIGSLVLAVATSVGTKTDGGKTAGAPSHPATGRYAGSSVGSEPAEPPGIDLATAARTAVTAVRGADHDTVVVGARLGREGVRLVWDVTIAARDRECVKAVLIDAGTGEVLTSVLRPGVGGKPR